MQTAPIKNTLPISAFGASARDIFADVQKNGGRIVVDNDRPAGILLSPGEYEEIIDLLADMRVEQIAAERLSKPSGKGITFDEMLAECGLTREALDAMPEVDIE